MVYLDDVIVYSETLEDHLTWLQAIFDHFTHHGLKLKPSKCHFFKEEITYLGHEISTKGMRPQTERSQRHHTNGTLLPCTPESGNSSEPLDTSTAS